MSRHQREFTCVHPSGLPLACSPRMERAPLGVSPDASDPAVTSDARQGGDRSTNTDPGLAVSYMLDPPISEPTPNRATSCRNQEVEALLRAHGCDAVEHLDHDTVRSTYMREHPPGPHRWQRLVRATVSRRPG